eukprot:scaffold111794_cov57-Phaeocystis_antarctica.AAC.1
MKRYRLSAPRESPRVPPAPNWSWLAGCSKKQRQKRKTGVQAPKRGFERGALRGTLRDDAVVPSTPRPVYHQPVSRGQPSGLQTPTVPLRITNEIDFGPIWGPFKVPRQRCGPMGCALGHRSSSVRRTGTIYGGPDTSHELSFEPCHQRGNQVKSS